MRHATVNRLLIIQSLQDGKTGTRLYEDIHTIAVVTNHKLQVELYDLDSKQEMLGFLSSLPALMVENNFSPILHFECHGLSNKEGLSLASGEDLLWSELHPIFININRACCLNTILSFAACYGAYFAHHISPVGPAPCWGMVGPIDSVPARALYADFKGFYQAVLSGKSGNECVSVLNSSLRPSDTKYYFTLAETLYDKAWEQHCKAFTNRKELKEQANILLRRLRHDPGFPKERIPSRNELMLRLKNKDPNFRRLTLEAFFMTKVCSKNWQRFELDKKMKAYL
jgi:hypothetical protein